MMSSLRRTFVFGIAAAALWASGSVADAADAPAKVQTKEGAPATQCSAAAADLPQGASRVFIGLRNGQDGSGASWADARDGSTATSFDKILRCYSEGCAGGSGKPVAKTENLIVCLGPGTFSTLGTYDYVIGVPHTNAAGFTLGKGWKVHGSGRDKTVVKLSAYLANTESSKHQDYPDETGAGLVFGTNGDNASNIEISDLTIDANYPELKSRARGDGIRALTLEAIHLRSDHGEHWIHDVNVMNAAGEIGGINIRWEAFPVWIVSVNTSAPSQNSGNVIENVNMSQSFGPTGCAITVANAMAEVRNNQVTGYPIGYGGWVLGAVYFHDNVATDTEYGFNIDSLTNRGVRIESNRIVHPRKFGIVVGGDAPFTGFRILNNTLQINKSGVTALLLRGSVTDSTIAGNTIVAENSSAAKSIAIKNYSASRTVAPNRNNTYQGNQISSGMKIVFDGPSQKSQNCFFSNHDEHGRPRTDLADNHNGPCAPDAIPKKTPE
ncbi:MAG TPA: hypothetical protein VFT65_04515 [Candidatus Angelobacter sp.]|nr:hypothetical protein [Candidatus Angelobacter sp.]